MQQDLVPQSFDFLHEQPLLVLTGLYHCNHAQDLSKSLSSSKFCCGNVLKHQSDPNMDSFGGSCCHTGGSSQANSTAVSQQVTTVVATALAKALATVGGTATSG